MLFLLPLLPWAALIVAIVKDDFDNERKHRAWMERARKRNSEIIRITKKETT